MNFDSSYGRHEFKDRSPRRWAASLVVLGLFVFAAGYLAKVHLAPTRLVYSVPKGAVYRYPALAGPSDASPALSEATTSWKKYAGGGASRLAILLTDPNSDWLGLAHGLKSIGVPFTITTDPRQALEHRVVLAYPAASRKTLSDETLVSIERFVRSGGTFFTFNVDNDLGSMFGFQLAVPSRTRTTVLLDSRDSLASQFRDPQELRVRFSDRVDPHLNMGSFGYTEPKEAPVAVFDDGTAAIVRHRLGKGELYAAGLDIGSFLLTGYNNREQHIARNYVNTFEPALDVFLRLLRTLYHRGEPLAVMLGTVPEGKRFSLIVSHDVDSSVAIGNCLEYARAEQNLGIPATYFIQTKYVRDFNDTAFFTTAAGAMSNTLEQMGMEVASHSVSHSRAFASFPDGSGAETYPDYLPFIKDPRTTYNGTIMGELRVSKFILEHFTKRRVVSFRPGNLSNPFTLPERVAAAGYHFTSATTADDSLTHLPFQLDVARSTKAEVPVFEIPVTIEDEEAPRMDRREPAAVQLSEKIARYGGVVSILIHPNVLDYKLAFEQQFVRHYRNDAYVGTYRSFGTWWAARNAVGVDVTRSDDTIDVAVTAPERIAGLAVELPNGSVRSTKPSGIISKASAGAVVLAPIQGTVHLMVSIVPARASSR